MSDVETAGVRQHDPVPAVGHHRAFRRMDLNRRGFGHRARLVPQPLPEHGPVLPIMRRGNPKRGPMIERLM